MAYGATALRDTAPPLRIAPTNFSLCRVSYIMRTQAGGTLRLQSSILVTLLIALGCTGCIFISSSRTSTTAPPAIVYVPNSPTSQPALWADPEIEALHRAGGGSVFRFTLPLAAPLPLTREGP